MTSLWNRGPLKITIILVVCGLLHLLSNAAHGQPQESAEQVITIPDGTAVHLYLMDDITSKKNKVGDMIRFKVRENVHVGGTVIIPAGSSAVGRVIATGRSGFMGHSGTLGLSVEYALAVNEAKIPVRGEAVVKGGSRGATTLESAAWLGPAAFIHKGTMLNAYVNGNQTVSLVAQEIAK